MSSSEGEDVEGEPQAPRDQAESFLGRSTPPHPEGIVDNELHRILNESSPVRAALAAPSSSPRRRHRSLGPSQASAHEQLLEGARTIWGEDLFDREQKRTSPGDVCMRALMFIPVYPVRYIQRLIQMGHEPVPPRRSFSILLRRHAYYYPSVFGYARAIARTDGWRALYRGVGAQVVEDFIELAANNLLYPVIHSAVHKIPMPFRSRMEQGDVPDTDPAFSLPSILTRGTRRFLVGFTSQCLVQVVVQPFHVVTVRTMAHFIGKEDAYNGFYSSIREIYRTEGLGGFFSGIVPALLGHLCSNIIYTSLWIMLKIVVGNISNDIVKVMVDSLIGAPLLGYIPGTYAYPFTLMTNLMIVNNTGLLAGAPSRVPIFNRWTDSARHLRSTGQLFRGSALLFPRYAYKDIPT